MTIQKPDKFFNRFLFSDFKRGTLYCANHANRYEKHYKAKKRNTLAKRDLRFLLKYHKKISRDYNEATNAEILYNGKRFKKVRTIKKYCPYSGKIRSLAPHLKITKFKVKEFAKLGIVQGLRKA